MAKAGGESSEHFVAVAVLLVGFLFVLSVHLQVVVHLLSHE